MHTKATFHWHCRLFESELTQPTRQVKVYSHYFLEQSRRDDLEGLAHVMYYLLVGSLPWQGIQGGKDKIEKYNLITQKKRQTKIGDLCEALPSNVKVEYALFYNYCRDLEFKETPDYGYLRRLLRDMIYKESFIQVIAFEWLLMPDLERYHLRRKSDARQVQVSEQFLRVPEAHHNSINPARQRIRRSSNRGTADVGKENTDSSSGGGEKLKKIKNTMKPPTPADKKRSPVLKRSSVFLSEAAENGPQRPSALSTGQQQPFQIVYLKQSQSFREQETRFGSPKNNDDESKGASHKRLSLFKSIRAGNGIQGESSDNDNNPNQSLKRSTTRLSDSSKSRRNNQTHPKPLNEQSSAPRSISRPGEIEAPKLEQLLLKYGKNHDIILEEEKTPTKHAQHSAQKTFLAQLQQSAENLRRSRLKKTPMGTSSSPPIPESPLGDVKLHRINQSLRKSLLNDTSDSPFERAATEEEHPQTLLRLPRPPQMINNKKPIILQRSSVVLKRTSFVRASDSGLAMRKVESVPTEKIEGELEEIGQSTTDVGGGEEGEG